MNRPHARRMIVRWLAATIAALALLLASSGVNPAEAHTNRRSLRVMTWNLYLGADLEPALLTTTPDAFLAEVSRIYARSRLTNFDARAEAVADEIEAKDPDLIGLQEVSRWETSGPGTPASEDFLEVLQQELASRGLNYAVASVSTNATVGPVPLISPCGLPTVGACLVTFTDRDVVLVNEDTRGLRWWNPQHGNFAAQLSFTPPLAEAQPVSFNRGWASIDGRFRGRRFHFVTTHLETSVAPDVQRAQAAELLAGPAFGPGADVVVGDINSAPGGSPTAPYALLTGQLRDAWSVRGGEPGYTCCQDPTLSNQTSQLSRRIDVILIRGARSIAADVVGDTPFAATPPLWPSDHAGVVADLLLLRSGAGGFSLS
jgi:endonuclease/exonuclease/phosphatase family metal-dependent hydrolase